MTLGDIVSQYCHLLETVSESELFVKFLTKRIDYAANPSVPSNPLPPKKKRRTATCGSESESEKDRAMVQALNSISSRFPPISQSSSLLLNRELEDRAILLVQQLQSLPEGPVQMYVERQIDAIMKELNK